MEFGLLLKRERDRAGLSQQALAAKCGVSPAYIYRLEKNAIDPPSRKLCCALAKALGLEVRVLLESAFEFRFSRWVVKEGYRPVSRSAVRRVLDVLEESPRKKSVQSDEGVSAPS